MLQLINPRINYKLKVGDYLQLFRSFFRKTSDLSILYHLLGTKNLLFFDNARTGLRFILENKLPPDSKVGIQPLTCPTVIEAIYLANCKPVFVDIDTNFAISPETLIYKIEKIDALILTHTFGIPAQVEKIKDLLNGKLLIEDCAHAFLTFTEKKNWAGSIGDYSIFSYGFGKFPNAIRGGFLKINNEDTDDFNKKYQSIIQKNSLKFNIFNLIKALILPAFNSSILYTFITHKLKKNQTKKPYLLPVNSPISTFIPFANLSVLSFQLKKNKINLSNQINNGNRLISAIRNVKNIEISPMLQSGNYFMLPILISNPNNFINTCKKAGVEVGQHFVKTRQVIDYYGYISGECPNYELLIQKLVTLPCHYNYSKKNLNKLTKIISQYNF